MLYKLGRYLQVLAMIILPIGMAANLARPEDFDAKSMLVMLAVGGGVFTAGYLLQQAAKPR